MKLMFQYINIFEDLQSSTSEDKMVFCYNVLFWREEENKPEGESIFCYANKPDISKDKIWQWGQHARHRLFCIVSVSNNYWMKLKIYYQK